MTEDLPPFLNVMSLNPFINNTLRETSRPLDITLPNGRKALGYKSEMLVGGQESALFCNI